MNRYIDRYVLALTLILGFSTSAYSQIRIDAPRSADAGKTVSVRFAIDKGADLRTEILKNGNAYTGELFQFVDLKTNQNVVLFTNIEPGTYSIAAGVNAEGKTYLAAHVITVSGEVPKPVVPTPKPDPKTPEVTLGDELQALYGANPDPTALKSMIKLFEDIKIYTPNLKSYGGFESAIVNTAATRLKPADLKEVRTRISKYLIARTGMDPRKWDLKTAQDACQEIIDALKAVKP